MKNACFGTQGLKPLVYAAETSDKYHATHSTFFSH